MRSERVPHHEGLVAGTDDAGHEVRFVWATKATNGGSFQSWRELVKNKVVRRDRFARRHTVEGAYALALARWEQWRAQREHITNLLEQDNADNR